MRDDLPSGIVTFLFTDVEGSTKLLEELGDEVYDEVLTEHRRVIREACATHSGVEVDTQGDAFFFAFPTAPGALAAASEMTSALASGPIQVRIGLHTGKPRLSHEGYVGKEVHFAARVAATGHGGQIVLSTATRDLVEGFEFADLGEHRLKDVVEPVAIYQLGSESFPPLKTISNTNLPRPASSFVGRDAELAEVVERIEGGARLLTLTGPGGSGKTRLALEAASTLVPEYKAGVFWVGLAALRDPALVTETIAQTLGSKNGLAAHIAEREMLLLLDNLEQVIESAPELSTLVTTCPNLTLLVTSRELLRVSGEVEYEVLPMQEPEAVALFCERAQLEPSDEIVELCARLDSLPLALELAAARAKALSPAQILDRLARRLDLLKGGRDADPRQQTLRATIEWSYELLSPDEQLLFARLAVFRGGCTLEAAEEICDADLDTLQSLVEKSLLRFSNERYWLLETMREYAGEKLEESGEAEAVDARHLDHFVAVSERAYEAHRVASEGAWLPIVDAEHDNLRAALDWARERQARREAQLAGAVAPYWLMSGHQREAEKRLAGALARYETRDAVRARALMHHGELEDAIPTLEAALALWREIGDMRGEALVLEAIGWAHDHHGDYASARRAHEESLAVRARAGVPALEGALARAGLCHVLVATSEVERAGATAEELLAIAEQADAPLMHQLALHFLADCPLVAGDYPEAERRYLRALAYARAAGLPGRATDEVLGVAMAIAGRGEPMQAIRLAAAAHAKQAEIGKAADHWWGTMQKRLLGGARATVSPAEAESAEAVGRGTAFDDVLDELLGSGEE